MSDVLLVGSGAIAEAVAAILGGRYRVRRDLDGAEFGACGAVVAVGDEPDADLAKRCRTVGVPLLPVRSEPDLIVVGPAQLPGRPGCPRCAHTRRRLARADPGVRDAL